jgi:hypothetical protein
MYVVEVLQVEFCASRGTEIIQLSNKIKETLYLKNTVWSPFLFFFKNAHENSRNCVDFATILAKTFASTALKIGDTAYR